MFAGVNAALQCQGREAWLPRRDEAYLGVLVDDLITKGVTEPYRMFTSRAEFRLQLREDNADMRLTEHGRRLGLVDDARWDAFNRKRDAVSRETQRLAAIWVSPRNLAAAESERVLGKAIDHEYNLADLLRRPGVAYSALMSLSDGAYATDEVSAAKLGALLEPVVEQIEIAAKYSGYIERQKDEVERTAHYEDLKLPADLDYMQVTALSIEVRQKLNKHRPETLGLASRISGVTPAAISLLLVHLKKTRFKGLGGAGAGGGRSRPRMRPLEAGLRDGLAQLGLDLDDGQIAQLLDYLDLIQKWNKVYNLTAVRDPAEMLGQHLLDSLAVIGPLRRQTGGRPATLLDVGSGAGLPGVVIAICCPEVKVDCVDTVAKKAAFIQQAAVVLKLPNLRGLHARVENLTQPYDVICSRAFASLPDFVAWSAGALAPQGVWLAMKGKRPDEEIAALPASAEMFHVEQLQIPGLDAQRCIVWMKRTAA